jgi:hypothetical protein
LFQSLLRSTSPIEKCIDPANFEDIFVIDQKWLIEGTCHAIAEPQGMATSPSLKSLKSISAHTHPIRDRLVAVAVLAVAAIWWAFSVRPQ